MTKVAVGVIMKDGAVLLCQRKQSARYPLKWEFPGGKSETAEPLDECLRRELREELGVEAEIGPLFHKQQYVYPDSGSFDISYYLIEKFSGSITNRVFEQWCWVPISMLTTYDILEGNHEIVQRLIGEYAAY